MLSEMLRGYTDLILLKLLLDSPSYGYLINQKIEAITKGELKLTEATLYTTFKRLEQLGYILSYYQEGKNKTTRKYYHITEKGKIYLTQQIEYYHHVQTTLNLFFKGETNETKNSWLY